MVEGIPQRSAWGANALALSELEDLVTAARRKAVRWSIAAALPFPPAVVGMVGEYGSAGLWSIPLYALMWGLVVAHPWYKHARASTRADTYRRLLISTKDQARVDGAPE